MFCDYFEELLGVEDRTLANMLLKFDRRLLKVYPQHNLAVKITCVEVPIMTNKLSDVLSNQ
eukprot:269504-Pyramimonas_sp.AAC.1